MAKGKGGKKGMFDVPMRYLRSRSAAKKMRQEFGQNLKSMPHRKVRVKIVPEKSILGILHRPKRMHAQSTSARRVRRIITGEQPIVGGRTPESHCRTGSGIIRGLGNLLQIKHMKISGRVKDVQSLRKKLVSDIFFQTFLNTETASMKEDLKKEFNNEWIGIRVVVPTKRDLEKLANAIRQLSVEYKDSKTGKKVLVGFSSEKNYIKNPRQDGVILGKDPKDTYRALHVFTYGLTGAPMEVQLWTTEMERNTQRLAKKYGKKYWKKESFRKGKRKLGDYR